MGEKVVIIAADLSPADTAQMKIDKVLGFATDIGGKTSHTAIVARSIEIPAVVGLESISRAVRTNDDIIVDGSAGVVIVHPDPEVRKRYEEKKRLYEEAQDDLLDYAGLPAVTKDNYSVEIGGNIEFIEEIPSAIAHGADGIGLVPDGISSTSTVKSFPARRITSPTIAPWSASRGFPGRRSAPSTWAATSSFRTKSIPAN